VRSVPARSKRTRMWKSSIAICTLRPLERAAN
jgi:hypothetical protein